MTRHASKCSDNGFEGKRNVQLEYVEEFREFKLSMTRILR